MLLAVYLPGPRCWLFFLGDALIYIFQSFCGRRPLCVFRARCLPHSEAMTSFSHRLVAVLADLTVAVERTPNPFILKRESCRRKPSGMCLEVAWGSVVQD